MSDQPRDLPFEHWAFPIALGFVAGFIDIFGFMAWHGLLVAHVTGNLIFFAVNLAQGQYQLVMKIVALPVFAASVAVGAWLILWLQQRRRQQFVWVTLLQAGCIGVLLVTGLVLQAPKGPDDLAAVVPGTIALFAMGLQNATMRMILNEMPPTTVMTGNITFVASEAVRWSTRFTGDQAASRPGMLTRRAKLIAASLGGFTAGAIAGSLCEIHVGYVGLVLPIAALLGLVPVRRAELRAAGRSPVGT